MGLLVPADAPRRGGEGGGVAVDGGGAYVPESLDEDVAVEEVRCRGPSRRSEARKQEEERLEDAPRH